MKKIYISLLAIAVLAMSCEKDEEEKCEEEMTPVTPTVTFEFESVVDGKGIELGTTEFTNALGQIYTISAWKYFVSNIEFYKDGNMVYKEDDSYHYINHKEESTFSFNVASVPAGEYDEIRYSFGIDAVNNQSNASSGDIDPGTGMLWPMDGYRFSNFDVIFITDISDTSLAFHVGGNSNYKPLIFDSGVYLKAVNGETTLIHSMVNLNKMFTGVTDIDFTVTSTVATEVTSKPIADNIANGMFTIHHIKNPE